MKISDFIIDENMTVLDAVKAIDLNGRGIAFICRENKFVAVLSDGDIRRHILNQGNMELQVRDIANYAPRYMKTGDTCEIKSYMKENKITAIPVINEQGEIVRIYFKSGEEIYNTEQVCVPVVIMAGGKGTRLYPYTQILPKPLIPIGNKTITEHIMDRFIEAGCTDVTMIVNYKKRFIETYFAEDSVYKVKFVEENEFYGTGGGLKLLTGIDKTFFMTNCDILLEADYADIYRMHKSQNNLITMVCAKKKIEIPYGTVEKDTEGRYLGLTEKPTYTFLINTGFYVIEPEFLDLIPENTFIHITDMIEKCSRMGHRIGVYEVEEDTWMDMGQLNELENMRKQLEKN